MGHEGVRIWWDLNDTLLQNKEKHESTLTTIPFTVDHLDLAKRLADQPIPINQRLRKLHDFADPNLVRWIGRNLPGVPKWEFLGTKNQGDRIFNLLGLLENMFDGGRSWHKYVESFDVSPEGYIGLRDSNNKGYENSVASGMPWTVRSPVMDKMRLILPYLSTDYGILLNPDLNVLSGGIIKPFSWIQFMDGVHSGKSGELQVVVDDDIHILGLAEHLGFIAFSTNNEIEANKQREYHPLKDVSYPGKKNGNGEIIFDCTLDLIAERVQKLKAA